MRLPVTLSWRRRSSQFARNRGVAIRHFRAEPLEQRFLLAQISGVMFDDLDGDGVRDGSEPGLSGWTIYHDDDGDEIMDAGEARVTTAGNGSYTLTFPGPDRRQARGPHGRHRHGARGAATSAAA